MLQMLEREQWQVEQEERWEAELKHADERFVDVGAWRDRVEERCRENALDTQCDAWLNSVEDWYCRQEGEQS